MSEFSTVIFGSNYWEAQAPQGGEDLRPEHRQVHAQSPDSASPVVSGEAGRIAELRPELGSVRA